MPIPARAHIRELALLSPPAARKETKNKNNKQAKMDWRRELDRVTPLQRLCNLCAKVLLGEISTQTRHSRRCATRVTERAAAHAWKKGSRIRVNRGKTGNMQGSNACLTVDTERGVVDPARTVSGHYVVQVGAPRPCR